MTAVGVMIRVGFGLFREMFDMHANGADDQVQQILPIAVILAEHHLGVGHHFNGAAIGNLQHGVAVGAADDGLGYLDRVAASKARSGGNPLGSKPDRSRSITLAE